MRLPLRHPPPTGDPPRYRCAHLDALAAGLIGIPLGPAASFCASSRSRGRHGNALQWHLGLRSHDSEGKPDWEGRIEIKLVSLWRRPSGEIGCDKVKVCEMGVDPWAKLANVLWVFADRLTRVVVGSRQSWLGGATRERLASSWGADPHFGDPLLFVEARETRSESIVDAKRAPAYYLASQFLADAGLLPTAGLGVFPFDTAWARRVRNEHGRDPVLHLAVTPDGRQVCRRCGGPLTFEPADLAQDLWVPARHGMPIRGDCAIRAHCVVDPGHLVAPSVVAPAAAVAILEDRAAEGQIWRLHDHVPEPSDHVH